MNPTRDETGRTRPEPLNSDAGDSRTTGLPFPGLQSWRGVYLFVLAVFAIYILSLVFLERLFP